MLHFLHNQLNSTEFSFQIFFFPIQQQTKSKFLGSEKTEKKLLWHHFTDETTAEETQAATGGLFSWVMGEHPALQPSRTQPGFAHTRLVMYRAKHRNQLPSSYTQSSSATDLPRDLKTTCLCASVYPTAETAIFNLFYCKDIA